MTHAPQRTQRTFAEAGTVPAFHPADDAGWRFVDQPQPILRRPSLSWRLRH
jgi:hypothetical protein